jgi:hypothetical protein
MVPTPIFNCKENLEQGSCNSFLKSNPKSNAYP